MAYNRHFKDDHEAHLKSDKWREIKRAVISRDKHCQDCGSEYSADGYFDCHHTTYENMGGKKEINDVILLCHNCHQLRHKKPIKTMAQVEHELFQRLYEV